ncbi:hypothetical protein Vretifemale_15408, partial [Volvox reticuliferus]
AAEAVSLHPAGPHNRVVRTWARPQVPLRLGALRGAGPMAAMTLRPMARTHLLGDDGTNTNTADEFSDGQYDSMRYRRVGCDREMVYGARYGMARCRGRSSPLHDTRLGSSPRSAAGMVYNHMRGPSQRHRQSTYPKNGVSCGALSPAAAQLIRKRSSATAGLDSPLEFGCTGRTLSRPEDSPGRPETTCAAKPGLCHNASPSNDISPSRCTSQRPDDTGAAGAASAAAAAACPGASASPATTVAVAMTCVNACSDHNESSSALMGPLPPPREPHSTVGFPPTPKNGAAPAAATVFGNIIFP